MVPTGKWMRRVFWLWVEAIQTGEERQWRRGLYLLPLSSSMERNHRAPFRSFEIIVEQYPIVGIALQCQVAGPLLQNSGLHRFQSFSFHDDILLLSLHMFC